eukprot:1152667-Pelagomonas_calceolata.AAC.1
MRNLSKEGKERVHCCDYLCGQPSCTRICQQPNWTNCLSGCLLSGTLQLEQKRRKSAQTGILPQAALSAIFQHSP